jgi:hypothetical protein
MIRGLGNLDLRIESWLRRRGYVNPGVRGLVKSQLYVATLCSAAALVLFRPWGPAFAAGALLATVNFFFLAKVIQEIVHVQRGAVAALLFGFYLRLILTGVALFLLIAWGEVSAVALLAGLTTVVVAIFVWSLFIRGKT